MDSKSQKMRFIGYSTVSKGYRLYDENKKCIFVKSDVIFNENDFDISDTPISETKRAEPLYSDYEYEERTHSTVLHMREEIMRSHIKSRLTRQLLTCEDQNE